MGEKCNPGLGRHPDYGFEEVWNELGQPSCFMVDLLPADSHSFLVTAEPQIAEAIVQPSPEYKYSIPKSDTMEAMKPLIGKESLITAEVSSVEYGCITIFNFFKIMAFCNTC